MDLNKPLHFDPHSNPASVAQRWNVWIKNFERFVTAANIKDDKRKQAMLLNLAGDNVSQIFDSLSSTDSLSYSETVKLLTGHFAPSKNVLYEIFTFRKCRQQDDESFGSFYSRLRSLSANCEFSDLDRELTVQIMIGTRSEELRTKILKDPKMKLSDVVIAGKSSELFLFQNEAFRQTDSFHETNKINLKKQFFQTPQPRDTSKNLCFGCGEPHFRRDCPFLKTVCNACKKVGHLARVCRNGKPRPDNWFTNNNTKRNELVHSRPNSTNEISLENSVLHSEEPSEISPHRITNETSGSTQYLREVNCPKVPEFTTVVNINNHAVNMEVDTGAGVSIVSEAVWNKIAPKNYTLHPSPWKLKDYSGQNVGVIGQVNVHVKYGNFKGVLPLIISQGNRNSLLGRNWLHSLSIEVNGVLNLSSQESNSISKAKEEIKSVRQEFSDVFSQDLGCYKGLPVELKLNQNVNPIHLRARPIPFALQGPVEEELNKLVKQGVIEPVQSSPWATPVVVSFKSNGKIRLCGDYKATLNKALDEDLHPIPPISQLLSNLSNGKYFAKLDLAQAYQQLRVDEKSALAQTIITHKGAFKVNRLQFGISSAPAIFQRFIESILSGLTTVLPYFDDILIKAKTTNELVSTLKQVLLRFRKAGITLSSEKCTLISTSVDFLGFVVTSDGLRPNPDKVKAIQDAPEPVNKEQLQAFLGLLNFYHSFLRNKATVAEPLHRLLDKNVKWHWNQYHRHAFVESKKLLPSDAMLAHYDPLRHLILTCDASQYGIGCVLSQTCGNKEIPVAFYSRAMSPTERRYAQIDREALAIIAGVKKFHNYLYGRHFEIRTDHKPLLGLFTIDKPTPNTLSPRMIRWSLLLSGYDFSLVYKPGSSISNADGLSRLPLNTTDTDTEDSLNEVLYIESSEDLPITADVIAKATMKDPILSKIVTWTLRGWPLQNSETREFTPFSSRQSAISYYKGCLLWGTRVIIPSSLRPQTLKLLHTGHEGIVRTKALARSYFWWPKLDEDIEDLIRACQLCQQSRHNPPKSIPLPWERTKQPWSRLHIDFAGPFQNKIFMIVVDSYSKWLEVVLVSSTDSAAAIQALRTMFSTHGLPDMIVSDNGTAFTSSQFKSFMETNGIRHILVAPYHPSSNGQAERMVQTTKDSLKRIISGDWKLRLAQFLLSSHVTPHCSTHVSPGELLFGRRIRTVLDRLHPDYSPGGKESEELVSSFEKFNQSPPRTFNVNDSVFAKNYSQRGPNWIPAIVSKITGPVSYQLTASDGGLIRRHIDQLRPRFTCSPLRVQTRQDGIGPFSRHPQFLTADRNNGDPTPIERTNEPPELCLADSPQQTPRHIGSHNRERDNISSPRPVRQRQLPPRYLDFRMGKGVLCTE